MKYSQRCLTHYSALTLSTPPAQTAHSRLIITFINDEYKNKAGWKINRWVFFQNFIFIIKLLAQNSIKSKKKKITGK